MTPSADPLGPDVRAATVFEAFYRSRQEIWRHYAFLHTADARAAEEITDQATLLLEGRWREALREHSVACFAWKLFRRALTEWQKNNDAATGFVQNAFVRACLAQDWSGEFFAAEENMWLYREIFDLPDRQHEVIVLRYMMDMSEARIAETLGIGPASVRSNIRHARDRLEALAAARHLLHPTDTEG